MAGLSSLPDDLPKPIDDGGAKHLIGSELPNITLNDHNGQTFNLNTLQGTTVVYCYPMTGRPDVPLPDGWDMIPGARGCTPQSCAFRDHQKELQDLNVSNLFGVSTQTSEQQQEAAERLHLPFPLLSDTELKLQQTLNLPTMTVEGKVMLKRLTMIIYGKTIEHVIYPVFPPDQNAEQVIAWLKSNPSA